MSVRRTVSWQEGPSIQLGAMSGQGISRILSRGKTEERYLMTCGASAGLAAAFHAPLAGVMFALEELHKGFSDKSAYFGYDSFGYGRLYIVSYYGA